MRRAIDGTLSAFAACITALVVAPPVWAAISALRTGLVGAWVWAPVLILAGCGAVICLSFLRKAGRGVHPMRERRR